MHRERHQVLQTFTVSDLLPQGSHELRTWVTTTGVPEGRVISGHTGAAGGTGLARASGPGCRLSSAPRGGSCSGRRGRPPSQLAAPSGELCPVAEGLGMGAGTPGAVTVIVSRAY